MRRIGFVEQEEGRIEIRRRLRVIARVRSQQPPAAERLVERNLRGVRTDPPIVAIETIVEVQSAIGPREVLREAQVRRPLAADVGPLFERPLDRDIFEPAVIALLIGIVEREDHGFIGVFEETGRAGEANVRLEHRPLVEDLGHPRVGREIPPPPEDRRLTLKVPDSVGVIAGVGGAVGRERGANPVASHARAPVEHGQLVVEVELPADVDEARQIIVLIRNPAADRQLGPIPGVGQAAVPLPPRLGRGRRHDVDQARMARERIAVGVRVISVEIDHDRRSVLVDMVEVGTGRAGHQLGGDRRSGERHHRRRAGPAVLREFALQRRPVEDRDRSLDREAVDLERFQIEGRIALPVEVALALLVMAVLDIERRRFVGARGGHPGQRERRRGQRLERAARRAAINHSRTLRHPC